MPFVNGNTIGQETRFKAGQSGNPAGRPPEARRILMVISDGAPIDDSTLSANSSNYMDRHLRGVIGWIEARSPVELTAIGIGHDATCYYSRAVTIADTEQLGEAMMDQLADLFENAPRKRSTLH